MPLAGGNCIRGLGGGAQKSADGCYFTLESSLSHGSLVEQTNRRTGDRPLHEIRARLHHHELQAKVQVHVVVYHERADDKHADECPEARPVGETGAVAIAHCVEHGEHEDDKGRSNGAERLGKALRLDDSDQYSQLDPCPLSGIWKLNVFGR